MTFRTDIDLSKTLSGGGSGGQAGNGYGAQGGSGIVILAYAN